MPIAKVQLEDGRIAKFEVPEGTSEADVIEFAKSQDFSSIPIDAPKQTPAEVAVSEIPAGEYGDRIMDAYREGNVGLAEYLRQRSTEVDAPESETNLQKLGRRAGDIAGYLGDQIKGAFEGAKDAFTGESKKTAASEMFPELAGPVRRTTPNYFEAVEKGEAPPVKAADDMQIINLSARTPEEKAQMWRERDYTVSVFPDEKGNLYVLFDNGHIGAIDTPGATLAGTRDELVRAGAFALGSRGGAARQIAGAMGTQGALEGLSYAYGGDFDKTEIALAGVLEGVGQGMAKVIGKAWTKMSPEARRGVKDWRDLKGRIPNDEFQKLKSLKEASEALDAPDILGPQFAIRKGGDEAVEVNSQLKRAVQRLEDAKKLSRATTEQDIFARKEVRDQIAAISPDKDPVASGIRKTQKAAEGVFETLADNRRVIANRVFGRALANDAPVDIRPIRNEIIQTLQSGVVNKGDEEKALMRVLEMMRFRDGTPRRFMRGELAQRLKFQLDSMTRGTAETSAGGAAKKTIEGLTKKLVDQIDATNPGYKSANAIYRNLTKEIEGLEEALVGVVRGTDESKLGRISRLFEERDTQSVKQVLELVSQEDPTAAFSLYKGWLDSKIGGIDLKGSKNPASDIYRALFAKPNISKRVFTFAPSPEIKKNLRFLKDYLEYSQNVRVSAGGQPQDFLQSGSEIGRQSTVQGPLAAGFKKLGDFFSDRKSDALTRALLNPRWAEDMKYIRTLPNERRGEYLNNLLNRIIDASQAEATVPEPEQTGNE